QGEKEEAATIFTTFQTATSRHPRDGFPARALPDFTPENRGRRDSRMRGAHPQPRVRKIKAHEHSHHRYTGPTRHSPRNGFNGLFRALPGEPGFVATIISGSSRQLDASVGASGPHGFAVRLQLRSSSR